jgi:DNA-binding Lrp family transcriptional regulator
VAPATRTTSNGKIRLTQTQVALAKKLGLTPQQYAAQVAKLENQNG